MPQEQNEMSSYLRLMFVFMILFYKTVVYITIDIIGRNNITLV